MFEAGKTYRLKNAHYESAITVTQAFPGGFTTTEEEHYDLEAFEAWLRKKDITVYEMKTLTADAGEVFWDRVTKAINSGLAGSDYAVAGLSHITTTYQDGSTVLDTAEGVPYRITYPEEVRR